MDDPAQTRSLLLVYWIIWVSTLVGLVLIYLVFGHAPLPPVDRADFPLNLAGTIPLFLSIVIRWLVLPRFDSAARALWMFVVGVALAEACGLLGIFLGGPYRDTLFALGFLAIGQFVPVFVKRLGAKPGSEFIPNR